MTHGKLSEQLLRRICCDNAEAMDFLANHWSPYVHEIDDIIDGEREAKRDILKTFARAVVLFSHSFYLKNLLSLRQLVINVTVTYADSVDWEKSSETWRRDWADHNRHAGMDMVLAVATICGGADHAFAISQEQRAICWYEHHDAKGNAI